MAGRQEYSYSYLLRFSAASHWKVWKWSLTNNYTPDHSVPTTIHLEIPGKVNLQYIAITFSFTPLVKPEMVEGWEMSLQTDTSSTWPWEIIIIGVHTHTHMSAWALNDYVWNINSNTEKLTYRSQKPVFAFCLTVTTWNIKRPKFRAPSGKISLKNILRC